MAKKKEEKAQENESTKAATGEEPEIFMGTVIWYDKKKLGYGFAVIDGEEQGENDVLVHHKQVEQEGDKRPNLFPGDRISFYLGDPPEGVSKNKPIPKGIKIVERAKQEEDDSAEYIANQFASGSKETEEEVRKRYQNKSTTGNTSG